MNYTDDDLSALLDGELDSIAATALREALSNDPELADRLEQLAFADSIVKNTYQEIDSEPLPKSVIDLLAGEDETHSNVVNLSRSFWSSRPLQIAAAAVLTLGVFIGSPFLKQTRPDLFAEAIAIGPIGTPSALESILSNSASAVTHHLNNDQADGKALVEITPVLSFQSTDGGWCREYTVATDIKAARALACRAENQWQIVLSSLEQSVTKAGDYATASTVTSAAFDEFIDNKIVGVPLSADLEHQLIENNWEATIR